MLSWRLGLLLAALASPTALVAGVPQSLPGHHPRHAAPISTLPDTQPLARPARPYSGTPIDVLHYHYDNNRTGWNQAETDLTPASVQSTSFGLLRTLQVDGNVFAQPLLVSGYTMPDGSVHDVLIVATGHNTVYAYDAQTYAILWQVSLGKAQTTGDVGCDDVKPEYGISSTPVIVRKKKGATLYIVSATEPSRFTFQTNLHALDLGTGADLVAPVLISPSATLSNGSTLKFDSQNQWSRSGLAINNGSIYVSIGSHCDNNQNGISGWMLRYDTSLTLKNSFHTIETPAGGGLELASIWMTGFAPAIDASGRPFVVTGNGDFTGRGMDWGESALALTSDLTAVSSRFTPSSYKTLNNSDNDFGSGGIMLLPVVTGQTAPPMAVAMGKDATLYLLNQASLGGNKKGDSGALQATRLACSGCGTWGGPAFYDSPTAGPLVYVQTDSEGLRAFSLATGATPALTQVASGTTKAGYGGSLPVVSSNGATPATGLVWLVRRSNPMSLEAYDANALGDPLFAANAGTWSNTNNQNSFVTAMVANGRVYAPAYKTVKVFGLTQ